MSENREIIGKDTTTNTNIDILCKNSIELIQYARQIAAKQINLVQLMTYYSIGRWIVEEQQHGQSRAQYGKQVIKKLSEALTEQFSRGFSVDTLENARKFYLNYQDRISETAFRKFAVEKTETVFREFENTQPFTLPWSHYLLLMRIKNPDERSFYEIEAAQAAWSIRVLQRQYNSSLYERIALSRDKEAVMHLASEGNVITKPADIVKQPTVLEFLGLEESTSYSETEFETAIINKLQKFLLELGKGYLFEARQKRFTFDEDNYYDRFQKLPEENPTIGILLCKEKNDALVEITLPENSNIFATEYAFYLPDKKVLQNKLNEWIEEIGEE
ncbi:MAG: DUF1016 family protein [Lachnospiraceae bacterium]|nr:DUF1016 family protein [Lachnospiraceae bacterium]